MQVCGIRVWQRKMLDRSRDHMHRAPMNFSALLMRSLALFCSLAIALRGTIQRTCPSRYLGIKAIIVMRCFNAKVTLYMPRITNKLRGNQAEAPTATNGTDAPLLRHACDQASYACVSCSFPPHSASRGCRVSGDSLPNKKVSAFPRRDDACHHAARTPGRTLFCRLDSSCREYCGTRQSSQSFTDES